MKPRHLMPIAIALALFLLPVAANAADKIKAVASFSILGDMVKEVGGDRVEVTTLVGPDGDAHVYEPTPADAKNLAASDILFINGLGFEGWMDRLEKSSGFKGPVVVASKGVSPRNMIEAARQKAIRRQASVRVGARFTSACVISPLRSPRTWARSRRNSPSSTVSTEGITLSSDPCRR